MNEPTEFWHVQLPDGTVSTMTLDELDTAFQSGAINERTYVLKQGDSTWATLASLLGLDEPAPAPQTPPRTVTTPASATPGGFAPGDFAIVNSLRPVVSDVDDDMDFDAPSFRSSKKRTVAIASSFVAMAAVGLVAATLGSNGAWTRLGSIRSLLGAGPVAAASPPPPAPVVAEPPAASLPPAVEAAPSPSPAPPERFTESQKRALLEADKARAAQQRAKMNASPPRRSGYKSDGKSVFHKGGDKYDPLNASL